MNRRLRAVLALVLIPLAGGCSTLVQVPRSEFAAEPERHNVRVRTQEGQQYAFDRVQVSADSLSGIGYQQRTVILADGEPRIDEVATRVTLPLDAIVSLEQRQRDWGRTARWGLGVAGATAFVVAVGSSKPKEDGAVPGGGKGGGPELP